MRLDTVTAEIRPRSDWEAVDLGLAMVRRSFWRCITVWWLALGVPMAVAAVLLWEYPIVLLALFWWWKPAGSRMVLFELSRRLFGEEPPWRSVWREIPRVWWRRFFYRFLWARFSPWLPVTLALEDLEGLRGKAYRQRCGQVVRRGEGVVMWIYFISDTAAAWVGLGLFTLVMMFIPEGQGGAWQQAVEAWDPNLPMELPMLVSRSVVGCMVVGISLVDVFVIGAGFGVYINNRTWIEGWDVELAFRRLAQRLGKVAGLLMAFFLIVVPTARAEDTRPPAELIREVKADPIFKVHTVKDRVSNKNPPTPRSWTPPVKMIQMMTTVFTVCVAVLLLGLLGWLIWRYRHILKAGAGEIRKGKRLPTARVVMGMEISPESLPTNVPDAAWTLWQQGLYQEALGLLYRGSISRVMELSNVEIHESDTENDCLRRVKSAGSAAHPDYFCSITGIWIRLAYAQVNPAESEVILLCEQWPFGEGRRM